MLLTTCDGAIFIVASPALCSHEQECCLVLPTGGGPLPDWLQEAPINIIPLSECETRLGGSWIYFNSQYQQCAFDNTGTNPDGPAGPCYGLCDVILHVSKNHLCYLSAIIFQLFCFCYHSSECCTIIVECAKAFALRIWGLLDLLLLL